MFRQNRIIISAALLALPIALAAQTASSSQPAPKMRRPGGGAGMDYRDYDAATLEHGKTAFVAHCGFCHGSNAKGGESGPDLIRSVVVIDDENGNLIAPVVHGGRQAQGMPRIDVSDKDLADIVAFLHEGVRAAAERGTYKVLNIVTGNPKAGEAYFNGAGKCTTCHSITGDLKGVGAKYDPVALQGKILMPAGGRGGRRASSPVEVTVILSSGQSYKGLLERIDDFTVSLTDANGDYHSFTRHGDLPKVVLKDPIQAHLDMLPKYTDADIHNLTAYLVTLK